VGGGGGSIFFFFKSGPETALCGRGFLSVKIIAIDLCAIRVFRVLAI